MIYIYGISKHLIQIISNMGNGARQTTCRNVREVNQNSTDESFITRPDINNKKKSVKSVHSHGTKAGEYVFFQKAKKSRKLMHNSETIKDKIKHHFYLYKNSHKKARDVNINVVRSPTSRIYGNIPGFYISKYPL